MARFLAVAALAVGLSAAADDKPAKDELARFAGTWKGVSVSQDGKDLPKPEAEAHRLVVDGEKYTLTVEGAEPVEGTHKLRATGKTGDTAGGTTGEIDAVRTKGPHKGESLKGVYQLTDDTFVACFAAPGKDRPAELKPAGGPGLRVLAFKRDKAK
ncbi:MAG: TIGR03067 domain-containing protein [Gemmataceae bacterium]|nr:TIGR03067 domain-containing protein [Gemmataceae bacterium]